MCEKDPDPATPEDVWFCFREKKALTNSTYSGILEIFFPYTKTY